MARRRLLADAFWAGVFALPAEEREVVRHCTLTSDDLALVAAKRSPHNRLAYALLLLALRHPGRALEIGDVPPAPMVAYIARQVGADPAVLHAHHPRPQTRREQLAELMRRSGLRSFGRAEARALGAWLTAVAGSRRAPAELATMLIEELRRRRVLLPTPGVLEGLVHEVRARAERVAHRALTEGMEDARLAALDGLLAAAPGAGPSRLAWLRGASVSPAAANLHGLAEGRGGAPWSARSPRPTGRRSAGPSWGGRPLTASGCQGEGVYRRPKEASGGQASTIGLYTAKRVFQAHGADAAGRVVFRKRLTRAKLLELGSGEQWNGKAM